MIHVCGDALAYKHLKLAPEVGNVLEAILGFCQLSVEFAVPIPGKLHMGFITVEAAYSVWTYAEQALKCTRDT